MAHTSSTTMSPTASSSPRADYFKVENNTVYGNSAKGASSGIHIKAAYNITGDMSDTTPRVIVRNNVALRQRDQGRSHPPTATASASTISATPRSPSFRPTPFRTLVEGNISYDNSGRGVQIAWSDDVTAPQQHRLPQQHAADFSPDRGASDLANMGSNYTAWIGNIAVADLTDNPGNTADRQRQLRRRTQERRRDLVRQHDVQRNPGSRPPSTATTATTSLWRPPTSSASTPA